ncbi:MAG: 6-pyruvoyl tetrahydropterin synthase family protein [Patescibacteria group bacterium]|nr:6-pyruvoyl tetrahydropterin synthase family protein [Patescibacteria group bacterium]
MTKQYAIRVAGDGLRFSAAHFITFASGQVEPLHGHDYHVAAELEAPLGPHGYTIDFLAVDRILKDLLNELDHRTLLPQRHPSLTVDIRATEIELSLGSRRWLLPREDCVLLPVENTTSEALAGYLAERLSDKLAAQSPHLPTTLRIHLTESNGFTATCTLKRVPCREPSEANPQG